MFLSLTCLVFKYELMKWSSFVCCCFFFLLFNSRTFFVLFLRFFFCFQALLFCFLFLTVAFTFQVVPPFLKGDCLCAIAVPVAKVLFMEAWVSWLATLSWCICETLHERVLFLVFAYCNKTDYVTADVAMCVIGSEIWPRYGHNPAKVHQGCQFRGAQKMPQGDWK